MYHNPMCAIQIGEPSHCDHVDHFALLTEAMLAPRLGLNRISKDARAVWDNALQVGSVAINALNMKPERINTTGEQDYGASDYFFFVGYTIEENIAVQLALAAGSHRLDMKEVGRKERP